MFFLGKEMYNREISSKDV